jgi:hypothetical protein
MRRINPSPELIKPGHWTKKNSENAAVNLKGKKFYAPLDASIRSAAIRVHEYGHIKMSIPYEELPITKAELKNPIMIDTLNAFEDHRVNYLLEKEFGLDIKPAGELKAQMDFIKSLGMVSPLHAGNLYASSRRYDMDPGVEKALLASVKGKQDKIDRIIKDLSETPTIDQLVTAARCMTALYLEPEEEEKKKGDGDGKDDGKKEPDTSTPPSRADREREYQEKKQGRDTTLLDTAKREAIRYNEAEFLPGKMEIVHPKKMKYAGNYRGVRIQPRKKPSQYGATFRYPHRVVSDKAVFSSPKRDLLGTILVDKSGSMHISNEDILKVMQCSSGATIAVYAGMGDKGTLVIAAQNHRVIKDLNSLYIGGGNVVDQPALEWLAKQPRPRWWICDGGVTGIDDIFGAEISDACRAIKKKAGIIQVQRVSEFMELLSTGKLRGYKDNCVIY